MGIACGLYRVNKETIEQLRSQAKLAQQYIDENYTWVSGKYHVEGDIAFETDKAWDIAKFLLKKCDPSTDKVLRGLDGIPIDAAGDWDSPRYITPETVKVVHSVLNAVTSEQLVKAYNQEEMVQSHVYRPDWWDAPDWEYIDSHVITMKQAFARAAECGDGLILNFH